MILKWFLSLFNITVEEYVPADTQGEPEMPDNVAQFWTRIARAKTVSYTMDEWGTKGGWITDENPSSKVLRVYCSYEVKIQRPALIRIDIVPNIKHGEINTAETLYVSDGKRSITCTASQNTLRIHEGCNRLEPIDFVDYKKNSSNCCDHAEIYWLFSDQPMKSYRLVHKSLVDSSDTVVYTMDNPHRPDYQQKIYFGRSLGDLIRISEFLRLSIYSWVEYNRKEFHSWSFDSPLPLDIFSTVPPPNCGSEEEFEKLDDGRLLKK